MKTLKSLMKSVAVAGILCLVLSVVTGLVWLVHGVTGWGYWLCVLVVMIAISIFAYAIYDRDIHK